jgi:hypothetical protein
VIESPRKCVVTTQYPDIKPPGFFLWYYIKDKVYATKVTEDEALKTQVREGIRTLIRGMLSTKSEEFKFWLDILRVTLDALLSI